LRQILSGACVHRIQAPFLFLIQPLADLFGKPLQRIVAQIYDPKVYTKGVIIGERGRF
jgi:hypothetical protein